MSASGSISFGPRLLGSSSGTLHRALTVRPTAAIARATPLPSEPGAILERALEQHATFVKLLESFGIVVEVMDSHVDDPYETAISDAAVLFENGALLTRPTSMARRAESDRLQSMFSRIDVPIAGHIAAPGLFDGGDVVVVGKTAYIGVGRRGNERGRQGFAHVAGAHGLEVVELPLASWVPSLSAVCAAVDDDVVVVADNAFDHGRMHGLRVFVLDPGESMGAGVLTLGPMHVAADMRFGASLRRLRKAGIRVESLDLYEFAKVGITPSRMLLALRRA